MLFRGVTKSLIFYEDYTSSCAGLQWSEIIPHSFVSQWVRLLFSVCVYVQILTVQHLVLLHIIIDKTRTSLLLCRQVTTTDKQNQKIKKRIYINLILNFNHSASWRFVFVKKCTTCLKFPVMKSVKPWAQFLYYTLHNAF